MSQLLVLLMDCATETKAFFSLINKMLTYIFWDFWLPITHYLQQVPKQLLKIVMILGSKSLSLTIHATYICLAYASFTYYSPLSPPFNEHGNV